MNRQRQAWKWVGGQSSSTSSGARALSSAPDAGRAPVRVHVVDWGRLLENATWAVARPGRHALISRRRSKRARPAGDPEPVPAMYASRSRRSPASAWRARDAERSQDRLVIRRLPATISAMRPFRFLADIRDVADARRLTERARKAEAIGYDGVVITDHLGIEQLAPMPALAVVAAATERLRIGTFVLNNDLRHPAVLAQDLATLDVLSGGRLDVGLGAGWNRPEYAASGIAFEHGARRVERLEEAIAVLKGLFADAPFSFEGRHYRISEMVGLPRPVQRPHPRFLIGGGGRRVLTLAAREADVVGLSPRAGSTARGDIGSFLAPATAQKVTWVREAAGDRLAHLDLNTYPTLSGRVVVTAEPRRALAEVLERVRLWAADDVSEADLLESPHVFVGTVDDLADKLRGLRERFGINSLMVGELDDRLTPLVERLAGN